MQKAISAENIVKQFGGFTAVNKISFNVNYGETFAILGENGAGKSTTMRMISCRSPLTCGNLYVDGLDVKIDEQNIRSILGVVPQENNLDPDLNVRENLLVYARYFRLAKSYSEKRSDELLDFVGLNAKTNAKVDELSGGMKRRLIIARALLNKPKILLLDEPTTGLDPSVRQDIWEKLEELRSTENVTIVLSTHYMDEAEKLSQRLLVMAHGKIVLEGVPGEIINRKVKKYALEIRDVKANPLLNHKLSILSYQRGNTHLYFAETTDELSELMNSYNSKKMILRPSNLEDVFLLFVNRNT